MKTLNYLKTISALLVVVFVALSCSTTKKTALNCPELPRSNTNTKVAADLKRHNRNTFAFSQKESKKHHTAVNRVSPIKKDQETITNAPAEVTNQTDDISTSNLEEIRVPGKIEYNNNLTASADNSIISVTNNDSKLILNAVESTEIRLKEVKYKRNDVQNSSIPKSDIALNKNSNSVIKSYAASYKGDLQQETTVKMIEPLGLAGFISGLAGLLILPFIFGVVAIVFGAISLGKILKHPDRYKGLGFAIAALIIGVVDIVWVLIVVAATV